MNFILRIKDGTITSNYMLDKAYKKIVSKSYIDQVVEDEGLTQQPICIIFAEGLTSKFFIFEGQEAYVMTENGSTFERIA